MNGLLAIIGRAEELFTNDINKYNNDLNFSSTIIHEYLAGFRKFEDIKTNILLSLDEYSCIIIDNNFNLKSLIFFSLINFNIKFDNYYTFIYKNILFSYSKDNDNSYN